MAGDGQIGRGQRVDPCRFVKMRAALCDLNHRLWRTVRNGEVFGAQLALAQRDQARAAAHQVICARDGHSGADGQGFILHQKGVGDGAQAEQGILAVDIGHDGQAFLGDDPDAGNARFGDVAADAVAVAIHKHRSNDRAFAGKDAARIVQAHHRAGHRGLAQRASARLAARQDGRVFIAALNSGCGKAHDVGQLVIGQRL